MTSSVPSPWLFSPARDVACFGGGALLSLGALLAWQAGWVSALTLVVIWYLGLHGPHFWATHSRTFVDRSEWAARRRVLLRSPLWFLAGPAAVGVDLAVRQLTDRTDVFNLYVLAGACWGYHHLVAQHFGFAALYRAKSGHTDRHGMRILKVYIVVSLWIPALQILTRSPGWLPWNPFARWSVDLLGLPTTTFIFQSLQTGTLWLFVAVQVAFGAHCLRELAGKRLNARAAGVAIVAVALHWLAVRTALEPAPGAMAAAEPSDMGESESYYAFIPVIIAYHNIQYLALVWQHNRRKYSAADAASRFGLAARVNGNIARYLGYGVLFSLVTLGASYAGIAMLKEHYPVLGVALGSALAGWAFMHYYVDSKIWHLRSDEALRAQLDLPSVSR